MQLADIQGPSLAGAAGYRALRGSGHLKIQLSFPMNGVDALVFEEAVQDIMPNGIQV